MTPEDEEFLTELYRNLTKQAVPPTSPLYVALEELPGQVMGPDAVKLLGRTITMTTPGEAFFLTGLRGSGKTVQLLRLKQELQRRGFAVVMFSAEDYLNMHEPLNVVDVLFFLVGAISDQAVEYDLIEQGDSATSAGWSRLWQWLSDLPSRVDMTGADVSTTLLTTTATLKAELRRDTAFVAQLREFLRGRLSELVEQANLIVGDLVDDMRRRWRNGEWKGLVVIVDSLDHNRAVDSEKFQQVRRALVNLFDKDYDNLRMTGCRTVFTLPMYVPISAAKAVRRVTNLRVTDRDRKANADGVAAAREVLLRRAPNRKLDRLLDDDAVDQLVLASGGHLRILLGLMMEVVTQAESLPVDGATVTAAIQQVRNGMLPLADDQRAMLRRVAASHELPLASQDDWDVVATLLDQHFVLGYQNGETWYDVHPLLHDEIDSAPAAG
ncbi:MAG: ATP-binding protein [Pseudonocardiales bacterium]